MGERRKRGASLAHEKWLLGELSPAEREQVEGALSPEQRALLEHDDAVLRARLLRELPPDVFAARVHERAKKAGKARARPLWLAMPMLAAAALALLLVYAPEGDQKGAQVRGGDSHPSSEGSERIKGLSPQLRVYRKRGERIERLASDAPARAHDVLQLGFVAAGRPYGVLVSIDGNGTVTLHAPTDEARPSALEPVGGERLLATSYELDDAPRFERFFFVTSREPLSTREVVAAARALARDVQRAESAALPLRRDVEQQSLLVRKEAR